MKRDGLNRAIFRGSPGCSDDAVPTLKDDHALFNIVEIEESCMFESQQWFEVERNTGTECKLLLISAFPVVLGLDQEPGSGIESNVRVDLWKELRILRATRTGKRSKKYPACFLN